VVPVHFPHPYEGLKVQTAFSAPLRLKVVAVAAPSRLRKAAALVVLVVAAAAELALLEHQVEQAHPVKATMVARQALLVLALALLAVVVVVLVEQALLILVTGAQVQHRPLLARP
jgi:hypothetical protein